MCTKQQQVRLHLHHVILLSCAFIGAAWAQGPTTGPEKPVPNNTSPSITPSPQRITGVDLPQLLGVWYGQYHVDDTANSSEMWLEISFQKPINGYEIHGYNRWNISDDPNQARHGPTSLGRNAQQFDTISGKISTDGQHIKLWEDHSQAVLQAILSTPEQMMIEFQPVHEAMSHFSVTLQRIDPHYTPGQTTQLGIDVSHHSGRIDWPQVVEQGFSFAYVKATEGLDNPDSMFAQHWEELQSLNFPHGAYHFYVTEDDPSEQAIFFANSLKGHLGDLPPVVDIELLGKNTVGDMSSALLEFLRCFEQQTGVKPMIYTTAAFWDKYYSPEFSAYPLWLSETGVKLPKIPFGWKHWTLWQNKVNRTVPGVEKNADISILHPELELQNIRIRMN